MSEFRKPILFSTRLGKISTPIDELFERFNEYGRELNATTSGEIGRLLIFGSMPEVAVTKKWDFIEYKSVGRDPVIQLIRILSHLRTLPKQRYCFIAGDIWLGGIQIHILKFVFFRQAKTQISVHGIPNFTSNPVLRTLKHAIFQLLLEHTDSIRVVSRSLVSYLSATNRVDENRMFISPIPISFPENLDNLEKSINLAIVGRLHKERGVSEALGILEKFTRSDSLLSIQIIGNGPLAEDVRKWRDSLPKPSSVSLLGHVPNSMVSEKLLATEVLLSCAAEEGYGLALREALFCGAFVVARRNSGTQELQEFYPEAVFLFDTRDQARDILSKIFNGEFAKFDNRILMQKQKTLDKVSVSKLAQSWIN